VSFPVGPVIFATLAGLFTGGLLAWALLARRMMSLQTERTRLATELESERSAHAREREYQEAAQARLRESFSALSSEALQKNSESFLRLAEQNLRTLQQKAEGSLKEREQAVEGLVRPIREALARTEQQIHKMEDARRESIGALNQHLTQIARDSQGLQQETRNLVQALRRPEVRGQWGEMTLRRLVELAGLVEHCDFVEQDQRDGEEGRLRPDMVVRLPGSREIVIDAKTPLDAYLSAVEARDDAERDHHLQRHLRNIRNRVKELASKAYWERFRESPDFVVLFIPGDQFLTAALEKDPDLLESALGQRVILATPTSLVALLRAVAFGWRQQAVAENAERIRDLGEDLYGRIATFAGHLVKVGKSLGSSVDHYNRAVGSFERQVTPAARRFTDLGIHPRKTLNEPDPLERTVRPLTQDSTETER